MDESNKVRENELIFAMDIGTRSIVGVVGDDMQDAIGKEVKKLIDIAYFNAQEILKQNMDLLHAIATELMAKEKINEEEFNKFFA